MCVYMYICIYVYICIYIYIYIHLARRRSKPPEVQWPWPHSGVASIILQITLLTMLYNITLYYITLGYITLCYVMSCYII